MRNLQKRAEIEAQYMRANGRKTLINALSGGVDSTAVAAISQAAAPDGTVALLLPCARTSGRESDLADGRKVAELLGIPHVTIDLEPLWKLASELFTQAAREMAAKRGETVDEAALAWAVQNLQPTLRLMAAGFFADAFQGLIMGTDNLAEHFLGYFSVRGDGVADRWPIVDCTKGEVRQLAREAGMPNALADRVPTAGLWEGQTDEDELGVTYDDVDTFLLWLLDKHSDAEPLLDETLTVLSEKIPVILADPTLPIAPQVAEKILKRNRQTHFKRHPGVLAEVLRRRKG